MRKLLTILLFIYAGAAFANKIYVGAGGSNTTGAGTIGNPYFTMGHAVTFASSGDTIFILPGIITETSTVVLPTGVSLDAGDTTAIVKGTMTGQFVSIVQMHSSEGTAGNQFIRNIKFDGDNLTSSWAISIRGRSNVVIYNCVFRDFQETAVNWSGRNDGVQAAPSVYATGNSFHDNIVTNSAHWTGLYGRGCFQFGGQDSMQIYNNYIRNDYRSAGLNGWPIKGCNDSWIKNCRIHHNTLISAPFPFSANGENNYWDFAMELFDNVGGNVIDSNILTGSIDINRQQKGSAAFSVWIHHNIIGWPAMQANRQSGIILEYDTPDAIVEWNEIKNTTDGIIFSIRGANVISNTIVRNNWIHGLGSTAGGYGDGIGTHGSVPYSVNGLFIYNNTVRCVSNGSQAIPYGINFSGATTITNWRVRNNIVTGTQEACLWSNVTDSISSSFFTHNFFYGNVRNTPFTNWQGTRTLPGSNTLSNNTTGTDANLINIDTPAVASPAIDAGVNVGAAFNGAAPDIGYFETGGSTGGGSGSEIPGYLKKVRGKKLIML